MSTFATLLLGMKEKSVVTPYNAEESKKAQVARMFDKIAPRYDLLNRVLSLGIDVWWRRRALGYLRASKPRDILDVATGTADVAIMAAKMLKPAHVTGIDIANQMLDLGRQKIQQAGLGDIITLETGDSEQLRFSDQSFDAVTVAFGVRNFENIEAGLKEISRVIKKNGVFAVLEFSTPPRFPVKQFYLFYFRYVLPAIGRFISHDKRAYQYLPESVDAFPAPEKFCSILHSCGFTNTNHRYLTFGIASLYIAYKN